MRSVRAGAGGLTNESWMLRVRAWRPFDPSGTLRRMTSALLISVLSLFLGIARSSPNAQSEAERIDAVVLKHMRDPGAAGLSVAVARGAELVYSKAHGFADLEFRVKADEETMFRIGSVTKQFTAAAILK